MDMSGGDHAGSLLPVWKPNWLRADLVDYISSGTSSGGTTTTTGGTATTTLSTPTDENEMAILLSLSLSPNQGELEEAIWRMMEETSRTRRLTEDDNDDSSSSDIHELTRAMVSDVVLLSTANQSTAHQLVDEAAHLRGYVPRFDRVSPLTSLMMETVSCLEEKLAEKSRTFRNQSFRFLFLINNSHFIWEQLQLSPTLVLESRMVGLSRKIENYIQTYLQLSWAPALSCLYNSTPLCMGRLYSPPAKFESEFQKTYNAQKFWKVPDPKLRRRLRAAVINKVIPSFEKYLEYNVLSPSRITTHYLMDMLQELFEG